jgi:hypothetical protein
MADQSQCISEPVPEPSQAPPSPRDLTPAGWDESAGFRETFLAFFDTPEHRQVLRHLAHLLHESALELARPAVPGGESATSHELRAAAADLRHLQGFLATVARGQEEHALSPADTELASLAGRQAQAVAGVAAELEQALT